MALAVLATGTSSALSAYGPLSAVLVAGAGIGVFLAVRVAMTAMPELVALLHSFVGLAAVLVGLASYLGEASGHGGSRGIFLTEIAIDVFIGAVTFTGSVVAFAKLRGSVSGKPLLLPGRHFFNLAVAIACLIFSVQAVEASGQDGLLPLLAVTGLAGLLGVHLVMAIGGADMPVVVSLLNSYSGWTASAAGFMLSNDLLIVTGALVGSSGAILSIIMCRAMNRSILSVVFGGFGADAGAAPASGGAAAPQGEVREISLDQTASQLLESKGVIFVPGYGMAVARAQHAVHQITELLREKGKTVRFAIHPVAGRLRHMKTPSAMIDLLSILPFLLELLVHHLLDLRFMRVFRLLRLLKLTRYTGAMDTLKRAIVRETPLLGAAAFVMLLLVVLMASLGYLFEHEAQPDKFENIPQSIYWAVITLASVGYGDIAPVTPMGRLVTIVLALLGIGIFAIPAALLSSSYTDQLRIEREGLKNELYNMLADGIISPDEADVVAREARRLHLSDSDVALLTERARRERQSAEDTSEIPLHRVAAEPRLAVEHYKQLLGHIRQLGCLSDAACFLAVARQGDRLTDHELAVWHHIQQTTPAPAVTNSPPGDGDGAAGVAPLSAEPARPAGEGSAAAGSQFV
jgi:hypothetical protein